MPSKKPRFQESVPELPEEHYRYGMAGKAQGGGRFVVTLPNGETVLAKARGTKSNRGRLKTGDGVIVYKAKDISKPTWFVYAHFRNPQSIISIKAKMMKDSNSVPLDECAFDFEYI